MHIDGIMRSNTSMLGHTNSKLVKNLQKTLKETHQITYVTFDTPNRQVMVNFFQTSRTPCGDHSEMVLGPFKNLTILVLEPLLNAIN
jgi:hypothetical protein